MIWCNALIAAHSQALFVLNRVLVSLETKVDPHPNFAFPVQCINVEDPISCCIRPFDSLLPPLDGDLEARAPGCLAVGLNRF